MLLELGDGLDAVLGEMHVGASVPDALRLLWGSRTQARRLAKSVIILMQVVLDRRRALARPEQVVRSDRGLWSWSVLGVWGKLTFTYSLDFWDFTTAAASFFGYWIGVLALPAIYAYYVNFLTESAKRAC